MSSLGPRDKDRWREISPYLDRAMDLDDDERQVWFAVLRRDAPGLVADLESLFRARAAVHAEGFLDDTALPPDDPFSPGGVLPLEGQVVGAYRLIESIGHGGMGSVWLAERCDGRFEGRAAVKLLNPSLIGPGPARGEERFTREGSMLARLTHPNIARLIDAGVSATGQPYLVLEYVDGKPIDRYCDERQLGIEARLRLFLDVLAAVAHAHANLVVHRDLKPSNVLVSDDGRVKLLDFGIAKLLDDDAQPAAASLTREGAAALTPEFAAPEQVTGNPVTTATDVYSLGVLMYLLLGGQHPAGSSLRSPADLVRAIVDTEPPRLSDAVTQTRSEPAEALTDNAARRSSTPDRLRRLLRGDLDTIVATALKKHAHERYASVTALADDVRRYLSNEPIGARPDTLAYRGLKFLKRHAAGVVAVGITAALMAVLVVFYTGRLAAERDRARVEAVKAAKVSELMTELLTGADPYRDKPDPSLRDVLDAGAERLQKDLATEPEILAEMLTSIGRVYARLELTDKAQPLLERALALGRGAGAPEHARVAQTLNDLGVLLRMKGNNAASVKMLEEAVAMRRRVLGPQHKDLAVSVSELGRSYNHLGDAARAETLAREALAMRQALLGTDHRETATSMGDLGLLLWQRGDLAGAETLLRGSLDISRRVLGDQHPNVSSAMSNLGLVVADRGDHAAAVALFEQALAIRRRALGRSHPALAVTLNNLAYPLRELRRYDEAIAAMEEALALTIPAHGDDSTPVAHYRVNLARVYLAMHDAARAEPLLRRALQVRVKAYAGDDWRIATARSLLGAALIPLRQFPEAESLLLDAKRVLKDVPGQQGREAKATVARLNELYAAWPRAEATAADRR
jgi:serine/threonine protein kinase/Tfp pilus assembly protein PilF